MSERRIEEEHITKRSSESIESISKDAAHQNGQTDEMTIGRAVTRDRTEEGLNSTQRLNTESNPEEARILLGENKPEEPIEGSKNPQSSNSRKKTIIKTVGGILSGAVLFTLGANLLQQDEAEESRNDTQQFDTDQEPGGDLPPLDGNGAEEPPEVISDEQEPPIAEIDRGEQAEPLIIDEETLLLEPEMRYLRNSRQIETYLQEQLSQDEPILETWRGAVSATTRAGMMRTLKMTNPFLAEIEDESGEYDKILAWAAPTLDEDGRVNRYAGIVVGYIEGGTRYFPLNDEYVRYWRHLDDDEGGQRIRTIPSMQDGYFEKIDYYEYLARGAERNRALEDQHLEPATQSEFGEAPEVLRGLSVQPIDFFDHDFVFRDEGQINQ